MGRGPDLFLGEQTLDGLLIVVEFDFWFFNYLDFEFPVEVAVDFEGFKLREGDGFELAFFDFLGVGSWEYLIDALLEDFGFTEVVDDCLTGSFAFAKTLESGGGDEFVDDFFSSLCHFGLRDGEGEFHRDE